MHLILLFGYFGSQENSEVKEIKEELSPQEEERLLSKEIICNYQITSSICVALCITLKLLVVSKQIALNY